MITTLLVANRGEVARRVMRTARAMGMRTVAVYSEPDAASPHVAEADRAVALGGSTSAETYLDQDKVLSAAKAAGADAVHPGYGFLSENASFARTVAAAGLTWVGPSPESIERMGIKHTAKDIARAAGVPTLPDALVGADTDLGAVGDVVGFPLLVKASAGGGGSGMRRVDDPDGLAEAIRSARAEASRSFGDGTVFLERLLVAPRHVEVQVLGDTHGTVVHLGERECSIQRRHQKVVEEAPSPAVSPELRERMGSTAVALARELGYVGAGTVEFLLDDTGGFSFLEMNTRLQVEHPVTEEVVRVRGEQLDLVRCQLEVADGAPIGFAQDDVSLRGHAVEVRLYAEDPAVGDRPSPGTVHRYEHDRDLRWEDALRGSGEVSAFYDPMLAKVIAHAPTRATAARRLAAGLAAAEIHGPATNRDLLVAVLRDPAFLAGETRTDFLERHPHVRHPPPATPFPVHLAAALACSAARRRHADRLTTAVAPGFRTLRRAPWARGTWHGHGAEHEVRYRLDAASGDTDLRLTIGGSTHCLALRALAPDGVRVRCGGVEWPCRVRVHDGSGDEVWVDDGEGGSVWRREPRLPAPDPIAAAGGPVSEIPGTVVEVLVAPGDRVGAGQRLVVLEAMKMEHPALAVADGVVEHVHVTVGQYVEAKAMLVTLVVPGASEATG